MLSCLITSFWPFWVPASVSMSWELKETSFLYVLSGFGGTAVTLDRTWTYFSAASPPPLPKGSWSGRGSQEEHTANLCTLPNLLQGKLCSFSPITLLPPHHCTPKIVQCLQENINPRVSEISLSKLNCWFWHKENSPTSTACKKSLITIACICRGFTWASLSSHKYRCSLFLLLVLLPNSIRSHGGKINGSASLFCRMTPPSFSCIWGLRMYIWAA